jgi:hypothetical protein
MTLISTLTHSGRSCVSSLLKVARQEAGLPGQYGTEGKDANVKMPSGRQWIMHTCVRWHIEGVGPSVAPQTQEHQMWDSGVKSRLKQAKES